MVCQECQRINFHSLLLACLQQCRERQVGDLTTSPSSWRRHYESIADIAECARDCALCGVLLGAVKQGAFGVDEPIGALSTVFRPVRNKIHVYRDSKHGLDYSCRLDVHINEAEVEKLYKLCQIQPDDSPPILRKIEKDPRSDAAVALASSWLTTCVSEHEACNSPPESWNPPKRLIQVGNDSQAPRLVEFANTSATSEGIKWVALSYCWGKGMTHSMELNRETMDELKEGQIPLHMFDATIRDAIYITRALRIPYIWIDALCIVQDRSGNDSEWNKEASRMNEIYGGATVTLVPADATSVMDGFLRDRQYPQHIAISSSRTGGGSIDIHASARVALSLEWVQDGDVRAGPWSSRGWTMQESLLSRRLLYYTSSQMIWKCSEEVRFETGVTNSLAQAITAADHYMDDISFGSRWFWSLPTFIKFKGFSGYLPSQRHDSLLSDPLTFRLWYDVIEEYCPRSFSKDGDRLVALSGLAKVYAEIIKCDEYVVGLWKPDLVRGLMWHTEGETLIPQRLKQDVQAAEHPFPSWSWVSAESAHVKIYRKDVQAFRSLARVDHVHIDYVDESQKFGDVKKATITLTGPVRRLSRLYNKHWKAADTSMSELERHLSALVEKQSPKGVDPRYSFPPPGGHFAVLQMLVWGAVLDLLVLESTGKVSGGIDEYRRVGTFKLWSVEEDLFRGSQSRTHSMELIVEELEREPWGMESVNIV